MIKKFRKLKKNYFALIFKNARPILIKKTSKEFEQ